MIALGLMVRTGRAAVVALGGQATAPHVVSKAQVDVAFTFDEGAVYHACQERPIEEARAHIDARSRSTQRSPPGWRWSPARSDQTRLVARAAASRSSTTDHSTFRQKASTYLPAAAP